MANQAKLITYANVLAYVCITCGKSFVKQIILYIDIFNITWVSTYRWPAGFIEGFFRWLQASQHFVSLQVTGEATSAKLHSQVPIFISHSL